MRSHRLLLPGAPSEALGVFEAAAEAWGGEWRGEGNEGRLLLPVRAGLRRGLIAAEIRLRGEGAATRAELTPVESEMHLDAGATGVLVFGALGGVVAMLWPFFPVLLQIAPVAAILAVVAWLLVASRLRSRDLEEFVALVEDFAAQPGPD